MADEQVPTQPVTNEPAALTFLQKFNAPLSTLWNQYKVFLIVFGVLILIVKFREVIIDLLISSSREAINDATKQDSKLKTQENQANNQANELIKEANDLNKNKPIADENWNKK